MTQETSSTGISNFSQEFNTLQEIACRVSQGITLIPATEFNQILKNLTQALSRGNNEDIALILSILTSIVKGGQSKQILDNEKMMKAIIKQFNRMAEKLQDDMETEAETSKLQYRMLSVLSLISQIIHENKGCSLPINKMFLNNLFMISTENVAKSAWKKETSRILSVILEKLSEQSNILLECGMFPRFRQILLENFKVIEDKNSFERLIRSIKRVSAVQPYSLKQFIASGAVQTVEKFFGKGMINNMLVRLNLQRPSCFTAFVQGSTSSVKNLHT